MRFIICTFDLMLLGGTNKIVELIGVCSMYEGNENFI